MIELENVSKKFNINYARRLSVLQNIVNLLDGGKKRYILALKNINLKINKGENVAIIGPNGSGKSTLLRIISGILVPTFGNIRIDTNITSFLQLGIGFHQNLTAKENVYLYGAILGKTRSYISKRFEEIIDFAELRDFVNVKLKDFSSGMQSRLAFSTAIYTDPETLVLDEVLVVGDLEFRNKCFEAFKKFKNQGKTMIFVSHDFDLIRKFFTRTIYLKNGMIVADGDTDKIIKLYEKDSK